MGRTNSRLTRHFIPGNFILSPDFDPETLMKQVLQDRPVEEGITVDADGVELIDDGIWIKEKAPRKQGDKSGGWTIKTYITDVPAMIPAGSAFEREITRRFANDKMLIDQIERRQRVRALPYDYIFNNLSLHQGKTRPALAFTIEMSSDFKVESYKIDRVAFKNVRKCNLAPLQAQIKDEGANVGSWYRLANGLMYQRLNAMANDCDKIVDSITPKLHKGTESHGSVEYKSEILIQELMRLTNVVALDYAVENGLTLPARPQPMYTEVLRPAENEMFNRACDSAVRDVMRRYSRGKPDKIRLSSPMQSYSDYVALKIVAEHVDSKRQVPGLVAEAQRLTEIFRQSAYAESARRQNLRDSSNEYYRDNPFDSLTGHADDRQSCALNNKAKDNGWERPDVAVQKITMQGGYLYMVGIEQRVPEELGGSHNGWGIALTYEKARELASYRVMERIYLAEPKGRGPRNTPG